MKEEPTLREIVEKLLQSDQKYRDSDKELVWRVWEATGFVKDGVLSKDDFLYAPKYISIDRCRRQFQRSDSLLGNNMVQASPLIKAERKKKSDQKGFEQIRAKAKYRFNNDTMSYEKTEHSDTQEKSRQTTPNQIRFT